MLPLNLLLVWTLVFLTAVSTAPVEEPELEVEAPEEADGEVSEEEEDDDESEDKSEAAEQRSSEAPPLAGSNIQDLSPSSANANANPSSGGGSAGSQGSPVEPSSAQTADGVDSEPHGNGQKLLNGGGASHTGGVGVFGGGATGGDLIGPGVHIHISGDVTPPPHLDQTGVTFSQLDESLDAPAVSAPLSDIFFSQSQPAADSGLNSEAHREHADAADAHGNGRQTLLTDAHGATDQLISNSDVITELMMMSTGTGLHGDLTASGLGVGRDEVTAHDVTVSGVYSQTDLVTMATDSHTDLVTMATDPTDIVSMATDSIVSDPTGSPLDYSHPALVDQTQTAGSITEQFHTSGASPEGAEDVGLEDTC